MASAPAPSLQATVQCGAVCVHLCGTCHFEPASAAAARALVESVAQLPGRTAAVAVELDPGSLFVLACAHKATAELPRERVRSEGVERTQEQLASARASLGGELEVSWEGAAPPLPPLVEHFLRAEGVLFGGEMCAAAMAGAEQGARLVCLREASERPYPPAPLVEQVLRSGHHTLISAPRPDLSTTP